MMSVTTARAVPKTAWAVDSATITARTLAAHPERPETLRAVLTGTFAPVSWHPPPPEQVWGPVYPVGGVPPGMAPRPDTDHTGERILQYLLDSLVALGLSLVPVVLLLVPALVLESAALAILALLAFLVASYAAWAWVEIFRAHRHGGQTYGMSTMDLRVVDEATLGEPTLGQLAIRWILLMLVDGGLLGLVLIMVTDRHQRLGDMAAKTLVVRADDPLVASVRAAHHPAPG